MTLPCDLSSAAVRSAKARSRSQRQTTAPDRRKRSAIARPMPCAPPVTMAVRSSRSILLVIHLSPMTCTSYIRDRLARDPDRVRKQRVTPFIQRPHEILLGMDGLTFALTPFSSVGIKGKMPNVVIAGFLPMLDRQ